MKNLFIVFLYLLSSGLLFAQTAEYPSVGNGSANSPFQIANWQNLYWISQNEQHWDKHYIQTADIDFNYADPYIDLWNDGLGWTPIEYFSGTYNGNGKSISGLYMFVTYQFQSNAGLFGTLTNENSRIENLTLIDVNISGYLYVGALVGTNNGVINNCFSSGTVTGKFAAGGLVGMNNKKILNSSSSATVYGTYCAGGLVGEAYNSIIEDSYFTGNVSSWYNLGGLMGVDSYNTIRNSYYDYETTLLNEHSYITTGALTNDLFTAWLENDKSLNIDDYLTYDGTNYLINNLNNFKTLLAFGQFHNHDFLLTENIDFSSENNFYIPYFSGNFNGNDKSINNFTLNLPSNTMLGLFGQTMTATIKNLSLSNVNINGNLYIGGLVGYNSRNSLITNCSSQGTIYGEINTGLLVGSNSGIIENSFSSGTVTGTLSTGGLVGLTSGFINNCYSSAIVNGNQSTGGLIGIISGAIIKDSFSTGNVKGNSRTGGFTGSNSYGRISNCYSRGNVTTLSLESSSHGGFIGIHFSGTITKSYATGWVKYNTAVQLDKGFAGGIGSGTHATEFQDCFWDITSSQAETTGEYEGITGKTTAEMKIETTFTDANWDFSETWQLLENMNHGYPSLQWQGTVSSISDENIISAGESIKLFPAYPNPFNPNTTISFSISKNSFVRLEIYNIKGQKVKTLINQNTSAGHHSITWNGTNDNNQKLSSGVYLYKIQTDEDILTNKMIMLK